MLSALRCRLRGHQPRPALVFRWRPPLTLAPGESVSIDIAPSDMEPVILCVRCKRELTPEGKLVEPPPRLTWRARLYPLSLWQYWVAMLMLFGAEGLTGLHGPLAWIASGAIGIVVCICYPLRRRRP
jgi:hypothetical protein